MSSFDRYNNTFSSLWTAPRPLLRGATYRGRRAGRGAAVDRATGSSGTSPTPAISGRPACFSGRLTRSRIHTCETNCTALFAPGDTVTVEAFPVDPFSYFFGGFGGDCGDQWTPCTITLDQDRSVTAVFFFD